MTAAPDLTRSVAAVRSLFDAAACSCALVDAAGAVLRYVAADGRIQGNTQCVYAMALKFDLLPEALRPKAAQYL